MQQQQQVLLRLPDVMARTGLKRWAVYNGVNAGTFPRGVKIGERAIAWRTADIDQWQASLRETYSVDDIRAAIRRSAACAGAAA